MEALHFYQKTVTVDSFVSIHESVLALCPASRFQPSFTCLQSQNMMQRETCFTSRVSKKLNNNYLGVRSETSWSLLARIYFPLGKPFRWRFRDSRWPSVIGWLCFGKFKIKFNNINYPHERCRLLGAQLGYISHIIR